MKMTKSLTLGALLIGAVTAVPAFANEFTANASVTNNYVWRGLTQTENNPAVQGGFDWAHDSGFYIGTWVSNVSYGSQSDFDPGSNLGPNVDAFNYEHDIYAGFSGGNDNFTWDVGYLYYNYDEAAEFDFGEIYGTIGVGGFSFSANVLTNTEADDGGVLDFDFGSTYYLSADYAFEVAGGLEIGFHVGYHDGDFSVAFNGVEDDYIDFNAYIARGGFSFMVSGTDLDEDSFATTSRLANDELRFVVAYSVDFDLLSD
ncbi:MAG: TorF family putative porin [Pseudomonadota bacterium]